MAISPGLIRVLCQLGRKSFVVHPVQLIAKAPTLSKTEDKHIRIKLKCLMSSRMSNLMKKRWRGC